MPGTPRPRGPSGCPAPRLVPAGTVVAAGLSPASSTQSCQSPASLHAPASPGGSRGWQGAPRVPGALSSSAEGGHPATSPEPGPGDREGPRDRAPWPQPAAPARARAARTQLPAAAPSKWRRGETCSVLAAALWAQPPAPRPSATAHVPATGPARLSSAASQSQAPWNRTLLEGESSSGSSGTAGPRPCCPQPPAPRRFVFSRAAGPSGSGDARCTRSGSARAGRAGLGGAYPHRQSPPRFPNTAQPAQPPRPGHGAPSRRGLGAAAPQCPAGPARHHGCSSPVLPWKPRPPPAAGRLLGSHRSSPSFTSSTRPAGSLRSPGGLQPRPVSRRPPGTARPRHPLPPPKLGTTSPGPTRGGRGC